MEPLDAIIEYLEKGKSGALATIISKTGATPRDVGAKVFIGDDGKIHGTVGGGCMEAEVWHHARSVIATGKPRILRYSLNGKTVEDEGMICGGTVEIFLEPVTTRVKAIYERLRRCVSDSEEALVVTKVDGLPFLKAVLAEHGAKVGDPLLDLMVGDFDRHFRRKTVHLQDGYLFEPLVPRPHLYVYGAGHISQYISTMAKLIDFHVTVVDDRSQFANRDRFPEADEVIVEDFGTVFESARPNENGYAVIVTRGHKHDADVLEEVLKRPVRYIGMIGSRRKVKIVYENLLRKGIDEDLLRTVHAPIGVDIDAETPQEIAVSIIAELIKARRRST